GDGHLLVTAGKRLVGLNHRCWLGKEEHALQSALAGKRYAAGAQTKNSRGGLPAGFAPTRCSLSIRQPPKLSNSTTSPACGRPASSISSIAQRPSGKTSLKL